MDARVTLACAHPVSGDSANTHRCCRNKKDYALLPEKQNTVSGKVNWNGNPEISNEQRTGTPLGFLYASFGGSP